MAQPPWLPKLFQFSWPLLLQLATAQAVQLVEQARVLLLGLWTHAFIISSMFCYRASEDFTRSRSSPLKELAAQEQRDESATGPPPLAEPPVLPADAVGRDLTCGLGLGSLTSGHHEPNKV